jgi:hypothetical protein
MLVPLVPELLEQVMLLPELLFFLTERCFISCKAVVAVCHMKSLARRGSSGGQSYKLTRGAFAGSGDLSGLGQLLSSGRLCTAGWTRWHKKGSAIEQT